MREKIGKLIVKLRTYRFKRNIRYVKVEGECKMMNEVSKKLYEELENIKRLQSELKISLRSVPKDNLRISYSHGKEQFFVRAEGEKGSGRYLKKKERNIAQRIAQRDYDRVLEKRVANRIRQLESILNVCSRDELLQVYDNLPPARKQLVEPRILTDEMYAGKWEAEEYVGKVIDENATSFYTEKGHVVRSKSEKIIADKLYKMKIPYRYEQPINLKGFGTIYPDFRVLNKRTRKEYYWEHLGKMDDSDYCEKAIKKINTYIKNGIYPGEQLILTFETGNCPLDVKVLEETIRRFLV